ncbi:MAG: hypothetical protein GEU74_06325 [Nitriliruptorales bacterium]|nr:hypothetical protein [Nitriliruptorales bacterium]
MSVRSAGSVPGIPYRGEDRRRIAGPAKSPFGRPYLVAVVVLAATALQVVFFTEVSRSSVESVQMLLPLLQVASLMIALALVAIAFSRWYLTSDAPAVWVAVALLVYAVGGLGAAELIPVVLPQFALADTVVWLRPASQLMMMILLVRAITMSQVAPIPGPKVLGLALAGVTVLAVVMALYPPLATAVDGAEGSLPRSYNAVNQIGLQPLALTALGAAYTWRGYKRRRWMFAWLALLFLALAIGDVARVYAVPPVEAGLLAKELLRLLGLLLAFIGATREIFHTYRDSATRLAESEFTAMTAHERIREGQAAAEERAHEARSALAAIEGATRTLEHYRERLPPETQTALSMAVSGEIRRLQRLVSVGEPLGDFTSFKVADSVVPLVVTERARGMTMELTMPADLEVVGRLGSTEQVLQTLFDNARRHAPGSPVTVRAERENGCIVVRVEDRGPGVAEDQREAIFRRGVRATTALDVPGSGLGLFVATELMREQSGNLWVEPRNGGGASFALSLPEAGPAESGEERRKDAQQVSKARHDRELSTVHRGH